jgi:hypothetical protein
LEADASNLSRTRQVDHTIPFDQGGRSGIGNDALVLAL